MVKLLHQSVTSVAQSRPLACAFRCGDQQITYGELDETSNRLANFLVAEGAKPGDRVGLYMPRCVETVVGLYAILKAGCIFVPLDPHLTSGGLATLVKACHVRQILTHPKKSQVIGDLTERDSSLEVIVGADQAQVSGDAIRLYPWSAFDNESSTLKADSGVGPDDPAYIMYSSGSTGRPKGITHTHASGLSYSRLSIHTYQVTQDDVIANHSPISFDMSTFGYFTSMLAGATTVLIPEAHTKLPASLASLMEREKITIWYSVPLALIQLLVHTKLASFDLSSLRWVKFGGEPFPPKYLKALMKAWPGARFSNVYGPAEVNQCTYYHVPSSFADDNDELPIPIGRVWPETEGLIVDEKDHIISDNQIGELVIHSPTMMQGYWGLPERNKQAYWIHRDRQGATRKFYRTGDLVQRRDDGNLMILGRKDRQIKIRGYRIELDEIEHTLCSLSEIEEAGVFCVEQNGTREIHAAAIPQRAHRPDEASITARLREILSPYSVPTKIHLVDHLPRTTSGKIDRKRLTEQAAMSTG